MAEENGFENIIEIKSAYSKKYSKNVKGGLKIL